jgi:hypothetical protein
MKIYEIHLPYFKQGDDMDNCIRSTETPLEALRAHADQLSIAAAQLNQIADIVSNYNQKDIILEGNVHYITISGPEEMENELLEEDLIDVSPWDNDEENEDEDDLWGDDDDEEEYEE